MINWYCSLCYKKLTRLHDKVVWGMSIERKNIARALKSSGFHVITTEHPLLSGDRVDLLAYDKPITDVSEERTLFVVEVKSDKADHEVLGQLKKAVSLYSDVGVIKKHWTQVVGVAVAEDYTSSGAKLLLDEGVELLRWSQRDGRFFFKKFDLSSS